MTILMTMLREERGMTKQGLSFASHVAASTIGQIESSRFVPYDPQLKRIAVALEYDGDPSDLLESPV